MHRNVQSDILMEEIHWIKCLTSIHLRDDCLKRVKDFRYGHRKTAWKHVKGAKEPHIPVHLRIWELFPAAKASLKRETYLFIIPVINGGYSDWCPFTPCSVTCGGGVKHRSRTCTNPPPEGEGQTCDHLGPNKESQECNTEACRKFLITRLVPRLQDPNTFLLAISPILYLLQRLKVILETEKKKHNWNVWIYKCTVAMLLQRKIRAKIIKWFVMQIHLQFMQFSMTFLIYSLQFIQQLEKLELKIDPLSSNAVDYLSVGLIWKLEKTVKSNIRSTRLSIFFFCERIGGPKQNF